MNKKIKNIICIASAVIAVAAAVYFAVKYRDKIAGFFARIKAKCEDKVSFTDEEYQDFADI